MSHPLGARVAVAVLVALCGASIARGQSITAGAPARSTLERIERAQAGGTIDPSAAARAKLTFLFDRAHLDPAWRASEEPPARCATVVLDDLEQHASTFDAETRAWLDRITSIATPPSGSPTYETTHFRITWVTSGPDAPSLVDVSPANGVPDWVERTGDACEQAWATEVGTLGYTAPALPTGKNAKYPVTYQAQDTYGYTLSLGGQLTQIVLRPNYDGFPYNTDPDGDEIGALRSTVAHELKHAIQRMYTPWTEGNWLELDATWMEDQVFDSSNDYYQFMRGPSSPFTAPLQSLLVGGGGSYQDCDWETYQGEKYGLDHLRRFWERRRAVAGGEPVLTTYEQNFLAAGTTFDVAFGEYSAWNFVCGDRATPGFGYEEAAAYPTTPAASVSESLPVPTTSFAVAGLAAATHLVLNREGTLGGTPEFTFSGSPNFDWQVSVLCRFHSGAVSRIPVTLSSGMATVTLTGLDWAELDWAALVVANAIEFTPAGSYQFSARAIAPVLISHAPLGDLSTTGPIAIRATVTDGAEALEPGSVTLTYRLNSGTPGTVPMQPSGGPGQFAAQLPAAMPGTSIEYRIDASGAAGGHESAPSSAGSYFTFQMMSVAEPFETAGGWTVGAPGDAATSGVWERATPIGTIAAPYLDVTGAPGTMCFVTGAGVPGGSAGDADVDGGQTTLLSPVFSFYVGRPYSAAYAHFWRWYSNQRNGRPDDVWKVELTTDDGASWMPVETITEGRETWEPVTVDLTPWLGTTPRLQFRFVASDTGNASLVEAAIDDFEILATLVDPLDATETPPLAFGLSAVSPNPSAGRFALRLDRPHAMTVEASVRDLQGRTVRRVLPKAVLPAGSSTLEWDGRDEQGLATPAGVYWIEVRGDARRLTRKLVRTP
jgi:hypothetical protein